VGEGAAQLACAEACARAILHLDQNGLNLATSLHGLALQASVHGCAQVLDLATPTACFWGSDMIIAISIGLSAIIDTKTIVLSTASLAGPIRT
jgi:hypothetical protein